MTTNRLAGGAFLDAERSGVRGAAGRFTFDGFLVAVAVAHLGDGAETGGKLRLEIVEADAPGPVAGGRGRGIHTCLAAELEDILQGIDGDVGDRAGSGADHVPDDLAVVVFVDGAEIGLHVDALVERGVLTPPAERGVVVVSTGVDDSVGDVAMREIGVAAALCEAELQDPHAWHAEVFAQLVDFRSDEAEVFGDEGQVSEDLFEAIEECLARSFDPMTVHGGRLVSGDGPEGFEAAEVVEADEVVERERTTDARDPPVEAAFFKQAPLVKRVAPALAGCGEVIRRDAGDTGGLTLVVELEDLGVRPDVGGVVADEDGDVTEDFD